MKKKPLPAAGEPAPSRRRFLRDTTALTASFLAAPALLRGQQAQPPAPAAPPQDAQVQPPVPPWRLLERS